MSMFLKCTVIFLQARWYEQWQSFLHVARKWHGVKKIHIYRPLITGTLSEQMYNLLSDNWHSSRIKAKWPRNSHCHLGEGGWGGLICDCIGHKGTHVSLAHKRWEWGVASLYNTESCDGTISHLAQLYKLCKMWKEWPWHERVYDLIKLWQVKLETTQE